jgi:hypothetical protein
MADKRAGATRKSSGRAPPQKPAKRASVDAPAPAPDPEALAAHAGKLARALHAKLKQRDPELALDLRAVLRAHTAAMVALFASEVAELRRDIE